MSKSQESNESNYVRLKFGDAEMEAKGSIDLIEKTKAEFYSLMELPSIVEGQWSKTLPISTEATALIEAKNPLANGSNFSFDIPETFAEWTENFDLKSHVDRFMVIGLYLLEKENIQLVDSDIILAKYRSARWELPTNPADIFYKASKRHFVTESETLGAENGLKKWRLTRTGYQFAQSLKKEN